ncbi:MAG: hypothetical protein QM479_12060 [Pseudomonadota bacterium]
MRNPGQKGFMKNYYSMAIFFFMMLLAFRLSGYLSGILCLAGVIIASPSLQLKLPKHRWWTLLVLFILSILFFPDLMGLKK